MHLYAFLSTNYLYRFTFPRTGVMCMFTTIGMPIKECNNATVGLHLLLGGFFQVACKFQLGFQLYDFLTYKELWSLVLVCHSKSATMQLFSLHLLLGGFFQVVSSRWLLSSNLASSYMTFSLCQQGVVYSEFLN